MATVTVEPDGITVALRPGECVLSALYRSGYGYRTGCRRGGCGICKVDLVEGEVVYPATVATSVLTAEERAGGTCLSCRAVPEEDIVIRLRDERLRRLNPFLTPPRGAGEGQDEGVK
ncbi:2Fe-2S iron-sulfur cluster-binding protein [Streptomyces sp. NPDC096012]|uniref:2Fe-2S iron-sulfur cluster-binding protein n=1 Tax=Streptomyces sp. NPDC096012 TaxID=3155684 RepID=UPI00336A5A0C